MATIAQLTRQPGKFIKTFLPFIQALRADGDPYKYNEAAFIINEFQEAWGGGNPGNKDKNFFVRSNQVKYTSYPYLRNASETALLANFRITLNSMDMSQTNSVVEFYAFVELFYKLVDPMTWFLQYEGNFFECPPDPPGCPPGMNFFTARIGGYRRPQVAGEGTGFIFDNPVQGDGITKQQVSITYRVPPLPCNPPAPPCIPVAALNNRYFVMNTDAGTGTDDIIWYDYEGTGVQPVVIGNGGPQTYLPVAIDRTDEWPSIQAKTKAVIEASGNWVGIADCPPLPPSHPSCGGIVSTLFEANVVGARIDTADGRNGFETPETTMYASDASVIANNLITDDQWQDAHNNLRVPYEAGLGIRLKYLLALDDLPCFPPEPPCTPVSGLFLQTPIKGVIEQLPINAPGVISNASAGITRIPVTD